jgi:hypothetical protein
LNQEGIEKENILSPALSFAKFREGEGGNGLGLVS